MRNRSATTNYYLMSVVPTPANLTNSKYRSINLLSVPRTRVYDNGKTFARVYDKRKTFYIYTRNR